MLVFHQINWVSAIKRVPFYYCHIPIFVFFYVFVSSLLLSCMLKYSALRVSVQMLYNTQNKIYLKQWRGTHLLSWAA